MEDFDRLKAMKDVLVDDATVRRQLDVITKLQQEIQQERRWKEAAQMSKPRNRKEWRVLLDLLRLIRTATNEQREIMLRLWESSV